MSKSGRGANETKAVVLLDSCMSCLESCRTGCVNDINIKCSHRFKGKVKVIACNGFASFMRLSDSQIVLYLLWPLMRRDFFKTLAKDCRFFIITRDKGFGHQVQKEWDRKKNGKTVPVMFFDNNEIKIWFKGKKDRAKTAELREITVEIITIQGNRTPISRQEEASDIIDQINQLVFKTQ